jgi:hypothetical protein
LHLPLPNSFYSIRRYIQDHLLLYDSFLLYFLTFNFFQLNLGFLRYSFHFSSF